LTFRSKAVGVCRRQAHCRRQVRIYPKKQKPQEAFSKISGKSFSFSLFSLANDVNATPHLAILQRFPFSHKNVAPTKKFPAVATFSGFLNVG